MKKAALLIAISLTIVLNAQIKNRGIYSAEDQDWKPAEEVLVPEWIKAEKEAVFGWIKMMEYRFDERENRLYLFNLSHKQTWIGSEKAIENNNKLYLPVQNVLSVVALKARVIQANGTVVNLDTNNIYEGVDDNQNEYQYFALEGLTVGCIVEYFIITKEYPPIKGNKISFQGSVPVYNLAFDLISPASLIFSAKSYNHLNNPVDDKTLSEQNRLYIRQDTILALMPEPMGNRGPKKATIVFRLDRNMYIRTKEISSFKYLSKNIYKFVNTDRSKSLNKKLDKILMESGVALATSLKDSVIKIEHYVKENFFIVNKRGESFTEVESILESKSMTGLGALRLYDGLFNQAGIYYNVVLTSDKNNWFFDLDFENRLSVTEILIHIPNAKMYISPSNHLSRGSFVDYNLMNQKGLFIKPLYRDGEYFGNGEVWDIVGLGAEYSVTEQNITMSFNPETEDGDVEIYKKTTGYSSHNYQTLVDYIEEDEIEAFKQKIITRHFGEKEVTKLEFENLESSKYPNEPLIVKATFPSIEFIESSANTYIIKIGELIGKQNELYGEDTTRLLPVTIGNPKIYKHNIKFNIPKGYQIKNTESLEMNINSGGEDPIMGFSSKVISTENTLELNIFEFYTVGELPKEGFESYRKVVNAAADFNKLYVVLEPL